MKKSFFLTFFFFFLYFSGIKHNQVKKLVISEIPKEKYEIIYVGK